MLFGKEKGEEKDSIVTKEVESTELYPEEIEDYGIASSYGELLFPKEWDEYVKTEVVIENDVETIQFWVELEGRETIHLFDIVFGGNGYEVGTLLTNEGEKINVCIESYSYAIDDTWSEHEKEILSSINHDVNYLLINLNDIEGFTPGE